MKQPTEKQLAAAAKKKARTDAMESAVAAAQEALRNTSGLSEAGIVKTRYWVALHDNLRRQIALKNKNLGRIENLTWRMSTWADKTADEAHAGIQSLKALPKPKFSIPIPH